MNINKKPLEIVNNIKEIIYIELLTYCSKNFYLNYNYKI